jgi:hypothetical protein
VARTRQTGEGSVYRRASDGTWIGSITIGWEGDTAMDVALGRFMAADSKLPRGTPRRRSSKKRNDC